MVASEVHTTRLAFFGRLADDLTRAPLRPEDISVSIDGQRRVALCKDDGHFAFADIEPSAIAYVLRLGGPVYQTRTVAGALPTLQPVHVTLPGEDELYLAIIGAPTPQNRVTFDSRGFVPPIAAGAAVIGEGGFTATVAEPLEGRDVNSVVLSTTAGLAAGQVLRLVRSPNLLLRPAPYYPFLADLTVAAIRVVENNPETPPVTDATVTLTAVDGAAPVLATAGTLSLAVFALTAAPGASLVLDGDDRVTTTNDRGDAILYWPGTTAVTSISIDVSKTGFVTATAVIPLPAKARTFRQVALTRV